MNNKSIVISIVLLSLAICTTSFTFFKTNKNGAGSIIKKEITDEVKIGKQIWMSKNLEATTFSNGEVIEEAKNDKEWRKAGKEGRAAWCYYMFKEENGKVYGKIYNWFAVNDPRGLAPKGWRVPSISDWETLVESLGGESVVAPKMKSTYDWGGNTNGDNSSGFNGLPGGHQIHADGIFTNCMISSSVFVFVGTTTGQVFYSIDNGSNWNILSGNLPSLSIPALAVHNNKIYAATDGKGIWVNNLPQITGVFEHKQQNKITLYPNPAQNVLHTNTNSSYKIYDILGNLCLSGNKSNTINIESLKSGVYFIELYSFDSTKKIRFVKE